MVLSKFALTDRVAIVTGSGSGIGKAIAVAFAEAGADVVVAGITIIDSSRTATDLNAVAEQIRALGREALVVSTDVRVSDDVANMVHRTIEEFGRIDILVNNAGGSFLAPALEISEHAFDSVVKTNLYSVFLCCKAVAQSMINQKRGSIINIASVCGQGSATYYAPYAAAKAGVINLTKTLSTEWAPYGIRVNSIAPGAVRTESWPLMKERQPEMYAKVIEPLARRALLGRPGSPEDIAAAAIYLASDAADWVTGQTINVNGGERGFTDEWTTQ